jgi:hypothetical protein
LIRLKQLVAVQREPFGEAAGVRSQCLQTPGADVLDPWQWPSSVRLSELKSVLEAVLFSAQTLSLKELRDVFATAVEHADGNELARSLKKVKEEELTGTGRAVGDTIGESQLPVGLYCRPGSL